MWCFNPRAPRGARHHEWKLVYRQQPFQSTRPARGATKRKARSLLTLGVSIHAPRAGRDEKCLIAINHSSGVSIHAPRAGRDTNEFTLRSSARSFNPRAPRGARRPARANRRAALLFQSTRPARGATGHERRAVPICGPFNPRAPRGARRCNVFGSYNGLMFQSTRPARGATSSGMGSLSGFTGFNPRAPRGARLCARQMASVPILFQSTRPARGATHSDRPERTPKMVSIHAPRAGRDTGVMYIIPVEKVSIHAPRAGRDALTDWPGQTWAGFNPRAPRGARLHQAGSSLLAGRFQSTRPARGATMAFASSV